MSNENEAGVLRDEAEEPEEQETDARGRFTGWGLLAAVFFILVLGTHQVLSANSERDDQLRKIRDAQERMN